MLKAEPQMPVGNSAVAVAPLGLRLLTLNTHKGFNAFNRRFVLHELREAIRGMAADLVFLQEVQGEHAGHRGRHANWPTQPQYEFLADSIWSQYAYGRNAVYSEGHHGNAVLSKFPIIHHDNHDISIAGPERRGLLHCVLRLPDGYPELHLFCAHLSLLESHRREQAERLMALIQLKVPPEAPLLVAGDFNDWRGSLHQRLRRVGLEELWVGSQGQAARSFPAAWPLLRLDRIYARNFRQASPVSLSPAPWSRLSDHLPLAAEVSL